MRLPPKGLLGNAADCRLKARRLFKFVRCPNPFGFFRRHFSLAKLALDSFLAHQLGFQLVFKIDQLVIIEGACDVLVLAGQRKVLALLPKFITLAVYGIAYDAIFGEVVALSGVPQ